MAEVSQASAADGDAQDRPASEQSVTSAEESPDAEPRPVEGRPDEAPPAIATEEGDREKPVGEHVESGSLEPEALEATLQVCVAEHESAQLAKLSGGLLQAREHMVQCSAVDCPEALRRDCVAWSGEIAQQVPTIVIDARDLGEDVESALVSVDGETVSDRLDGRPLELDPGAHAIQIKLGDGRVRERRVVLSSGEKGRRVSFVFREEPQPVEAPVVVPIVVPGETRTIRPVTPLTYVLGGVALVAAGVGTGFGVRALKMKSEADDSCAPLCDASVKRAIEERAAVSDIAWGVAGASAIGALVSYVWRPTREVPLDPPSALSVEVRLGATALAVGGSF